LTGVDHRLRRPEGARILVLSNSLGTTQELWEGQLTEFVERFRVLLTATPPEGYARCCEALAAWDARERISAITAPVLVIAGADDPATSVEHAELIASRIPGARLQLVEHAAHLANVERPEAFTRAALEHLGQEVSV
jgi:3-oxoadipate enol-lactonase